MQTAFQYKLQLTRTSGLALQTQRIKSELKVLKHNLLHVYRVALLHDAHFLPKIQIVSTFGVEINRDVKAPVIYHQGN